MRRDRGKRKLECQCGKEGETVSSFPKGTSTPSMKQYPSSRGVARVLQEEGIPSRLWELLVQLIVRLKAMVMDSGYQATGFSLEGRATVGNA